MIIPKDGPNRSVARPLHNLGSTCFVNCVLQALAHAPELCLAMDTESHSLTCPTAAENAAKCRSSPSSSLSPDDAAVGKDPSSNRRSGTRKSKRSSGGGGGLTGGGGRKSPASDDGTDADLKYCALCELEYHVRSVHDTSKKDKPLAPTTFVNGFIEHVAPWFKLGVQEDAHEFLRLLIDAMQKSCLQARVLDNPQDDPPTTTIAANSKDDKEYPFSLFRGMVESKVKCAACHAISATVDPIEDVGLEVSLESSSAQSSSSNHHERSSRNTTSPLLGAPSLADVTSAFQRFAREETLDGYKCEKCGSKGRATKQSRLASIPPILTLHLKRFRYGADARQSAPAASVGRRSGRSEVNQLLGTATQDFLLGGKTGSAKIEGHIKFDVCFDLKPYLTHELQTKEKSMFCRLFAVIVHAGKTSHSGHYIAYVQSLEKNEWWKMDDGRVTLAHTSEVMQAEAYMLFYRVLQHPVTVSLEESYKRKQEEIRTETISSDSSSSRSCGSASASGRGSPNATAASSLVAHKPKRRRPHEVEEVDSYASGEEWARAKAPRLVGVARYAQELAAEALQLSSDCVRRIETEASKASAATLSSGVQGPSFTISEGDADPASVQVVRRQLCDLFYRLAQHYGRGDNNGPLSMFGAAAPAAAPPPPPPQPRHRVKSLTSAAPAKTVEPKPGVVEPDEATDVL